MNPIKKSILVLIVSHLAPVHALAFPKVGIPRQSEGPGIDVYFEELIGRKLSTVEEHQVQDLMGQVEDMKLRPQNVAVFGGTEIIPLICGQFKANFHWARGIGGEINPCFDPTSGKSYIMRGTSFSASPTVAAALQAGVYIGPSHLNKPVVGQYGFVSMAKDIVPFIRAHGQVSASLSCIDEVTGLSSKKTWARTLEECQFLAFGGLGFNVDGLFRKFKDKLFSKGADGAASASVAGAEITVGVIFSIVEFPWYERLRNGAPISEAFADWKTAQ